MKKKKSALSIILCFVVLLSFLPTEALATNGTWDGTVASDYSSGSGSKDDPFVISTAEQLAYFSQQTNQGNDYDGKYFELGKDIYLNDPSVLELSQGIVVGIKSEESTNIWPSINNFNGYFDGKNNVIYGLYAKASGLFRKLGENGSIVNLKVAEGYVYNLGGYHNGGIVSKNYGAIINCHNHNVTIYGADRNGGIAGNNIGTIRDCTNDARIGYHSNVGGIAGSNDGSIINCTNNGKFECDGGGITGYNSGLVEFCINNGDIEGASDYSGGIVGTNNRTVNACYNTGKISCTGNGVGGIASMNQGLIENCYNSGIIFGRDNGSTGGLVYINMSGVIQNCYNYGTINGDSCAGGIVASGTGTIENCYNYGSINSLASFKGGIISDYLDSNDSTVVNCYYDTDTCTSGGILGKGMSTIEMKSSTFLETLNSFVDTSDNGNLYYWIADDNINQGYPSFATSNDRHYTVSISSNHGGKVFPDNSVRVLSGRSRTIDIIEDAGYKVQDVLVDGISVGSVTTYQFTNINENHTIEVIFGADGTIASGFEGGNGSDIDPYIIKTTEQLAYLAQQVNLGTSYDGKHFKLENDLEFNPKSEFEKNEKGIITGIQSGRKPKEWIPIGSVEHKKFAGHLDGNNHTISGIYINSTDYYVGLFGRTDGATITNLKMIDGYIKSTNSSVGTIVGEASQSTINSCYTNITIEGNYSVGGIAGSTRATTVSNCKNEGKISGYAQIGGIIGEGSGTINSGNNVGSISGTNGRVGGIAGGFTGGQDDLGIVNCSNIGTITNLGMYLEGCVGGIVGMANGRVINSFNMGDVYGGDKSSGGIAGSLESTIALLANCYNVGTVLSSRPNSTPCAVVGYLREGSIENCYYDNQKCSASDSNAIGLPSDQLKSFNTINLLNGYTVSKDWANIKYWENDTSSINSGYPVFSSSTSIYSIRPILSKGGSISPKDTLYLTETSSLTYSITPDAGYVVYDVLIDGKSVGPRTTYTFDNISTDHKIEVVFSLNGAIVTGYQSGSGSKEDPYIISSANEFTYFANRVNSGETYKGKYFKLKNDIELNPSSAFTTNEESIINGVVKDCPIFQWTPIGKSLRDSFNGDFDGNNFCIKGVYINGSSNYQAVFNYLGDEGKVHDLTISKGYISNSSNYTSGLIANNRGTIINCRNYITVAGRDYVAGLVSLNSGTIENSINGGMINGVSYVGGLTGENKGQIVNCENTTDVKGKQFIGGIIGFNYRYTEDCSNKASVYASLGNAGGIAGQSDKGVDNYIYIKNCINSGNIKGGAYLGGIVGSMGYTFIDDCYNCGDILSSEYSIGGICGSTYGYGKYNIDSIYIKNSKNTGMISGTYEIGGIVGSNDIGINNNYNEGIIKGSKGYIGGIVGDNRATVLNCGNSGSVSGSEKYVGGIVGYNNHDIINSFNTAAVIGHDDVGGIVGYTYDISSNGFPGYFVSNCYNSGAVTGTGLNIGGAIGTNSARCQIKNSYYSSNNNNSGVGTNLGIGSATGLIIEDGKNLDLIKGLNQGVDSLNYNSINHWATDVSGQYGGLPRFVVEPPYITPVNEMNTFPIWVSLKTKTEGAEVYYTIDGSVPTEGSIKYTDPILLNKQTTIKAIAIKTDFVNSDILTSTVNVIPNQNQPAPVGLLGIAPTSSVGTDGKITGTTTLMEYKLSKDVNYKVASGVEINGLAAGTYDVRFASRIGYNASPITTITVPAYVNSGEISGGGVGDGGGGVGGGGTGSITSSTTQNNGITIAKTNEGTNSTVTATTLVKINPDEKGHIAASITNSQISDVVKKVIEEAGKMGKGADKKVEIVVDTHESVRTVETTITKLAFNSVLDNDLKSLKISSPISKITFDDVSLKTILKEAPEDVKIITSKVDAATLPDELRTMILDGPVYNFNVISSNKSITQLGGNVSISVPYTPKEGEDLDSIVIYYINAEGKPEIVKNSSYNAKTGMVTFMTNHFSQYAVGYHKVSFKDVLDNAWYSDAVAFIGARGITSGTGDGNYSPQMNLTRGQLLVLIMNAYGISPDENSANNFSDSGRTYYTGYLAAAKRLGIAKGIGDNMYAPDKEITRQEMVTLLYNALNEIGELPSGNNGKELNHFKDAGQVETWAKDSMTLFAKTGNLMGTGDKILPTDMTNRAQMAQILYNLLKK